MTQAQDDQEAAQQRATLVSALETSVEMVRHDLQDYAKWDDAVRHISLRFDAEWIDDNVTAYLGKTQGYDKVYVIGPDGSTAYAFSDGKRSSAATAHEMDSAFSDSVKRVRSMRLSSPQPILSGFTRSREGLFIYAVAAVVPLTSKVHLPPGQRYVLAIAQRFDDSYLVRIARERHFPVPRLSRTWPVEGPSAVSLRSLGGDPLGFVTIKSDTPGASLRNSMLPGLMLILLAVVTTASIIIRQGRLGVDALRESQSDALHHANHDLLTALPNRRMLLEQLGNDLAAGGALTLLYMDLDGFKGVNDLYGHAAGDSLLREVGIRLSGAAGPDRLVSRTGGDEFAIIDPSVQPTSICATYLADAVIDALRPSFFVNGTHINIGVSIGIVVVAGNQLSFAKDPVNTHVDELMRRADVAMYGAKAQGKNRCCVYRPEMDEVHDIRKRLEQDLRAAVEANAISVAYQPIMSPDGQTIMCVEALARWTHTQEGSIAPATFIPLAEMTGLIGQLGSQVLKRACEEVGPFDIRLAVNLSPAQFWDAQLVDHIGAILLQTGFPPSRLELEITENYLLDRPEAAMRIIEGLRNQGISLALDDFGSGFASIGYLQRFKFDRLKIDKQFVAQADSEPAAIEILAAIVALGQALGLKITAEGVETEDEAALLRASGCHNLQGYYFGRPGPLEDLLPRMLESARIAS